MFLVLRWERIWQISAVNLLCHLLCLLQLDAATVLTFLFKIKSSLVYICHVFSLLKE